MFKSGNKYDVSNYRLISLLSSISKILEKLILSRTLTFLNKHCVILPTQNGFRPNHSTIHAILDVITSTYDNFDENSYTALLLLDLKKAFNTVDHVIILAKLKHYGIRGVAHDLFSSFLSNKYQFTSLDYAQSSNKKINCGIPQGSVLGPLLFLLYINDINNCTSNSPRLLADDSCLILQDNLLNNLHDKINAEH